MFKPPKLDPRIQAASDALFVKERQESWFKQEEDYLNDMRSIDRIRDAAPLLLEALKCLYRASQAIQDTNVGQGAREEARLAIEIAEGRL